MPNADPRPHVAALVYDGLCTFEYGVAYEVFGLDRPELGPSWYSYAPVAVEPGPLRAQGGLSIVGVQGLEALDRADLIVVPGWRGLDAPVPDHLVAALRRAHRRGARLASLCSGVFVLAATGLLDGRAATTHWRYADTLARRFPAIDVRPDVLYVDNGGLLTAAGSAAGIDLCLHIVRRDHGPAAANSVARRLVVPPHRDGGQAQFIERPVPVAHESQRLGALVDWLRANLAAEHRLDQLAERAGMSLRTFQRRFEEMTGLPPGAWLIRERVDLARALLERPEETPLDDIASACGFGASATLRHHFKARVGLAPSAYRRRFGPAPSATG